MSAPDEFCPVLNDFLERVWLFAGGKNCFHRSAEREVGRRTTDTLSWFCESVIWKQKILIFWDLGGQLKQKKDLRGMYDFRWN